MVWTWTWTCEEEMIDSLMTKCERLTIEGTRRER